MERGYGLESEGVIPGRSKIFLFSIASKLSVEPTWPPIHWVLGLFPQE
jgi:hypothetical protein